MAERKLTLTILGDAKGAVGAIAEIEGKLGGFGGALQRIGETAAGFLTAQVITRGVDAVKGFVGDSIQAASDLEQSIGGVQSVFGDSADQILEWGKTADQQAGLSRNAFNQLASPLGAMLKNAGVEDFTDQTIELTKRAADMAATFGGPVDQALGAITAALRGETDPIERYGVSLNAAKVEARALADTGKATAASLTDQEKASARLALLYEQTADAAGQFGREADTAAGKVERQRAAQENAAAQLGEHLLPIQIKVTEAKIAMVRALSEHVIPAFGRVSGIIGDTVAPAFGRLHEFVGNFIGDIQWLIENGSAFSGEVLSPGVWGDLAVAIARAAEFVRDDLIPAFERIAEALRPAAEAVAEFASSEKESLLKALGLVVGTVLVVAFGALAIAAGSAAAAMVVALAPVIAITAAIAALAFGVVKLVEHWDSITEKVPILGAAFDAFKSLISGVPGLIDAIAAAWRDRVAPVLAEAVEKFRNDVFPVLERFGDLLEMVWKLWLAAFLRELEIAGNIIRAVWDEVAAVFKTTFALIAQIVETGIEFVRDTISIVMALIRGDWDEAWEGVKTLLSNVWENIGELIEAALDAIEARIDLAWSLIESVTREVWELIADILGGIWDGISGAIGTVLGVIGGAIEAAWNAARDTSARVFGELKDRVVDTFDNIRLALLTGGARIRDAVVTIFTEAKDWAGRAFAGIADLIRTPINAAIGFINRLIGAWNSLEFSAGGGSKLGIPIPSISFGTPDLPYVPYLAEGGIVMPRPGGVAAVLAEAGQPEAVIPLDRMGSLGGVTVHVHVQGAYIGERQIEEVVISSIRRAQQRGVSF